MKHNYLLAVSLFLLLVSSARAQIEILDNQAVAEMSRAGLGPQLILTKINSTRGNYDISAAALVELKKAGVDDEIIARLLEVTVEQPNDKSVGAKPAAFQSSPLQNTAYAPFSEAMGLPYSESGSAASKPSRPKSIAFVKSSLQPARQALEKELLKRKDWRDLNLTILRYKEEADLFVEIGFVSGSWITHRYVYRVYDRRSGAVLTAGETTSWGSLAENLARHISKRLTVALRS